MYRDEMQFLARLFVAAVVWISLECSSHAVLVHHYPIESETAGVLTDTAGGISLFYTDPDDGVLSTDVVASGSTQSFDLVAVRTASADFADELFQAASFSTALWYRQGNGGASNPSIFGVLQEVGPFQHNFLLRDSAPNGGNLRFFSRDTSDNTVNVTSSTQINDDQWHHIAATFDSATLAVDLYVDGVVTGSGTFTGWSGWSQFDQTFAGIGNPGASLAGTYDDVRIYDNALSASEVANLASAAFIEIDRQAGTIDLINDSGAVISIAGYTMASSAGALVDANWKSITDNYDANSGGAIDPTSNWSIQTSSKTDLTESANSPGTGAIGDGATFRLGDAEAWLANPTEDVSIAINLSGGGTLNAITRFVGTPISFADLNADGSVNSQDWVIFRGNLEGQSLDAGFSDAELLRQGDLDTDFDVDRSDFVAYKNAFIAATSAATFAGLGERAVPEPSAAAIAILALTFGSLAGRRRGRS